MNDPASPSDAAQSHRAAVPYIRFASDGRPFLQGCRCGKCGQTYVGERENCARCAARGGMLPIELATTGKLYNYTIVYRSFPGVAVPFISAVIDLDGGGTIKGNLLEVPAEPDAIAFDMPVKIVFGDAGLANPAGAGFTAFFFVPQQGAEQ